MRTRTTTVPHPAKFPPRIIEVIKLVLMHCMMTFKIPEHIFDPFLGTGGIAEIGEDWKLTGMEIEPEWAKQASERGIETHVGDSRRVPFPDRYFGAICTSPAYGNRLADNYAPDMKNPKHKWRRTYRISLGRPLSQGNGGALRWGNKYRELHAQVWKECVRVLCDGGLFILNIKDHYRKGKLQRVPEWHRDVLLGLGLELIDEVKIPLKGDQNTNTMRSRGVKVLGHELLYVFRKPTQTEED
jgi:tRNA G10  N-methylase Trm11